MKFIEFYYLLNLFNLMKFIDVGKLIDLHKYDYLRLSWNSS